MHVLLSYALTKYLSQNYLMVLLAKQATLSLYNSSVPQATIPDWALCPITHEKMAHPVIDNEGNSYEQSAILLWLRSKNVSPITRNPLYPEQLSTVGFHFLLLPSFAEVVHLVAEPNRALKHAIEGIASLQALHVADSSKKDQPAPRYDPVAALTSDPRFRLVNLFRILRDERDNFFDIATRNLLVLKTSFLNELEVADRFTLFFKICFGVASYLFWAIILEFPSMFSSFVILCTVYYTLYYALQIRTDTLERGEKGLALLLLHFFGLLQAATVNFIRTSMERAPFIRKDILFGTLLTVSGSVICLIFSIRAVWEIARRRESLYRLLFG